MLRAQWMSSSAVISLAALCLVTACSDPAKTQGEKGADSSPTTTLLPRNTCSPVRRHAPGTKSLKFAHDGRERSYNLTVPKGYDGVRPAPLIFSFHGLGSNKDQQDAIGIPVAAGKRGYIVVTPQALPTDLPIGAHGASVKIDFWNIFPVTNGGTSAPAQPVPTASDDMGFVNDLVTALERTLCIDSSRVYLTGISNGAGMAIELACVFPQRFAAAAPVAGVNMTNECPTKRPISVVAVHGDADPLVAYTGGTVAGFKIGNPGVEQRMTDIGRIDHCAAKPSIDEVSPALTIRTWKSCASGKAVVLYTLHRGGHTWPVGEPLNATTAILDFFDAHHG
jgi:polyhydroxybutyrate depolymerase